MKKLVGLALLAILAVGCGDSREAVTETAEAQSQADRLATAQAEVTRVAQDLATVEADRATLDAQATGAAAAMATESAGDLATLAAQSTEALVGAETESAGAAATQTAVAAPSQTAYAEAVQGTNAAISADFATLQAQATGANATITALAGEVQAQRTEVRAGEQTITPAVERAATVYIDRATLAAQMTEVQALNERIGATATAVALGAVTQQAKVEALQTEVEKIDYYYLYPTIYVTVETEVIFIARGAMTPTPTPWSDARYTVTPSPIRATPTWTPTGWAPSLVPTSTLPFSPTPPPLPVRVTPTWTPTPVPTEPYGVVVEGVEGVGNIDREAVTLRNLAGAVNLRGWQLCGADDVCYTFPRVVLFPRASVTVYSDEGDDSQVALYWGRDESVWQAGDAIRLLDAAGEERARWAIE